MGSCSETPECRDALNARPFPVDLPAVLTAFGVLPHLPVRSLKYLQDTRSRDPRPGQVVGAGRAAHLQEGRGGLIQGRSRCGPQIRKRRAGLRWPKGSGGAASPALRDAASPVRPAELRGLRRHNGLE